MDGFAYYNGTFGRKDEITIPLSDRCIYFGDGIYDAAIGREGKIFLCDEHIERFLTNAKRLELNHPYTPEALEDILLECVRLSGYDSFFLYFQLSRGDDKRAHSYNKSSGTNLLITVDSFTLPDKDTAVSLITQEDLRYYYCDIKTLNLLPSVMASARATEAEAVEAVFHRGDTVTECAHSNIAILKDGILCTHPTTNLILPGITRRLLIKCATELSIQVCEQPFTISELFDADEVIITSTSKLALIAEKINGIAVGGKDYQTARRLCDAVVGRFVHY